MIKVGETTVTSNGETATPPIWTSEPLKFVPMMETMVPTEAGFGVNEVIVGGAASVTVKLKPVLALPLGVITVMGPSVAFIGTMKVSCWSHVDEGGQYAVDQHGRGILQIGAGRMIALPALPLPGAGRSCRSG